jgi:hypothetical protein
VDPAPKEISTVKIPEDGEGVSQDKNRKPKVTFNLHTKSDLLTDEGLNESGDDQSREWTTECLNEHLAHLPPGPHCR